MDNSSLPQLDFLSKSYSESFAAFCRHSDQSKRISEWISEKFEEEITCKLVKVERQDENAALSVLGIGSGDGKFEVKIIMKLLKKFRLIEYTVVEPSSDRIASYKKLVEEQRDALTGVMFDWRQESFQEFCSANVNGSKKFHCIIAIHSFYYVAKEDLDYYLKAAMGWTEGKIVILLCPDTSTFPRLQEKFSPTFKQFPRANDVMDSLKALRIHFETTALPSECDVTTCFESGSRNGKLVLDFLLQVARYEDDRPPELLKMIQEFLESDGLLYTRNGRFYVPVPTEVIVISTSEGN